MDSKLKKHLNLNVQGLPLSATLGINEKSNQLLVSGRTVYKLGLGQSPFPVPELLVSELKSHAHQKDYLPVMGLMDLRRAVAGFIERTQGVRQSPENVMIGPGSKELMFILQLVYYGDLLISTPSWVSYAPQAHIIGRHIQWLSTQEKDHWKLQAKTLEALCAKDPERPRLLILNYPANPHGYTFDEDELKAIARVCKKYGVVILSDEIYGELNFDKNAISIARFYPEGTIISNGISKWCGAGGWRLGTFIFPEKLAWLKDAMATVASETYTSTSAPIQYAAIKAFQGDPQITDYVHQSRRILKSLTSLLAQKFRDIGIAIDDPDGGFYLFPNLSRFKEACLKHGITSSAELCEQLLQDTGVAVLPGSAFGRPERELTIRLAFVDFDGTQALAAAQNIAMDRALDYDFLQQHCGNCTVAIERLVDWLLSL